MGNLNNDHLSYLISVLHTLKSSGKHATYVSVLVRGLQGTGRGTRGKEVSGSVIDRDPSNLIIC